MDRTGFTSITPEPIVRTGNATADVLIALSLCEQRDQVPSGTVQQFLADKNIIPASAARRQAFHNAAMDARSAITEVKAQIGKLSHYLEAHQDNYGRAAADALRTAVIELQRHSDKLDAIETGRIN